MRCKYCGTEMEPDSLYCPRCKREVRYVPDYNPLEDVLAAQVRESWSQGTTISQEEGRNGPSYENYNNNQNTVYQRPERAPKVNGRTGGMPGNSRVSNTGRTSGSAKSGRTEGRSQEDQREYRRRQAARKQERLRQKRKQRRVLICSMLAVLALIAVGIFLLYQNSYSGLVKSGNSAIAKEEYNKAIKRFEKAASKSGTRAEAYVGLSKVYLAQKDTAAAENIFLKAVEKHPATAEIYKAACKFYVDTEQLEKISPFLDDCSESSVLKSLSEYTVNKPAFNLDQTTYDDVQQLKLSSKGNEIYYTLDGSDPTSASTKYSEPIQVKEGDNIIKAIAYNKKNIPSLVTEKTYKVVFPTAGAPSVTPSTGRYDQAMKITIAVPDGYTAYYTLDGSEPTSSSEQYTEPIDMPKGTNTIFSAVLIDQNGRVSDVAKRNYDLDIE